jgi:GntR family transcriptional repressor for pyruvate dehydrogenase complex
MSDMLKAVKRTRLSEEIMAQLVESVRQGKLQPGERLPSERELAEQLGVSRASVREALRALSLKGLVVSRPGAGTFVATGILEASAVPPEDERALRDIFELRMLLEPPIAALAAQRAAPADIERLRAILKEQAEQVQRGITGAEADQSFHSALAEATGNSALLRLSSTLMAVLAPTRDERLQTPQRIRLSLQSHQRILDAVAAGNLKEARQAMEEHIGQVDLMLFGVPKDVFDAHDLMEPDVS